MAVHREQFSPVAFHVEHGQDEPCSETRRNDNGFSGTPCEAVTPSVPGRLWVTGAAMIVSRQPVCLNGYHIADVAQSRPFTTITIVRFSSDATSFLGVSTDARRAQRKAVDAALRLTGRPCISSPGPTGVSPPAATRVSRE